MHYSKLVAFVILIVSAGARNIRRQESCYGLINKTCVNAGDQFCCVTEGQPGTFASCDYDGEEFYVASCGGISQCIQNDDSSVSCT